MEPEIPQAIVVAGVEQPAPPPPEPGFLQLLGWKWVAFAAVCVGLLGVVLVVVVVTPPDAQPRTSASASASASASESTQEPPSGIRPVSPESCEVLGEHALRVWAKRLRMDADPHDGDDLPATWTRHKAERAKRSRLFRHMVTRKCQDQSMDMDMRKCVARVVTPTAMARCGLDPRFVYDF